MRTTKIVPGEYYHVLNRGNNKQNIFIDERDWIRFLFLTFYLQSPVYFSQIGRNISSYFEHQTFNITPDKTKEVIDKRYIELLAFALMPNHFHFIVKETQELGISNYLGRIQNAYTKYFNTKYEKSGHLFQGPFRIVHIETNEQLLHLSAYIHRNVRELKEWENNEEKYPWSSYQDYTDKNRWGELLKTGFILNQFSNPREYQNFIETSGTKLKLDEEI